MSATTETAASSSCVGVASRCAPAAANAAVAADIVVVRGERVEICRLSARCSAGSMSKFIKARSVLQERNSGEAKNPPRLIY